MKHKRDLKQVKYEEIWKNFNDIIAHWFDVCNNSFRDIAP